VLYYPYGETRSTDGTLPTDYKFTGQRAEGFGLYDYHARYYDGAIGRFVSADTIVPQPGNPQDFNRYAYVRNSPLNYRDPSGHRLCRDGDCQEPEVPDGWPPSIPGHSSSAPSEPDWWDLPPEQRPDYY